MKLNLEKVYVSLKGNSLGKTPAVLLGSKDMGILIRKCNKAGCPVPVGTTRACDMDVYPTGKFVEVESTKEEDEALAQLSNRLGNYDEFYKISNPNGVDPLFVRYREFFPGLLPLV